MDIGRLCQIILKSEKEISGYVAIFAYEMVRQTPLIALPPLRFPDHSFLLRMKQCVTFFLMFILRFFAVFKLLQFIEGHVLIETLITISSQKLHLRPE